MCEWIVPICRIMSLKKITMMRKQSLKFKFAWLHTFDFIYVLGIFLKKCVAQRLRKHVFSLIMFFYEEKDTM